ncbi:hypothetical protein FOA52_010652 [Chlamydomonas sp. UWO 241]|nr:hypothetical protein FOA52_010652 [Chlamydomonas sp. UWO 241]
MASALATSYWEEAVRQLLEAAATGDVAALERVLFISAEKLLMGAADEDGSSVLMHAATACHVEVMRLLLDHRSANPASMLMHVKVDGYIALMVVAEAGQVEAMRLLLDHPTADPEAMMMHTDARGRTAFNLAASEGKVDAMRLLLDHPSADAVEMIKHANPAGYTALMVAAEAGQVEAMRLLLDHPSADPAAMMMCADAQDEGCTALMLAAQRSHVDAMRLLLDHPAADPAAMIALRTPTDDCALTMAAQFAADETSSDSWRPLLFLLRRVAMKPQPCDDQRTCMTKVLETLCQGRLSKALFDSDQPDDIRDECIRLLLERGARCTACAGTPVVSRVVCELAQMAHVPQLINDAVVGMAVARQGQQQSKPRPE